MTKFILLNGSPINPNMILFVSEIDYYVPAKDCTEYAFFTVYLTHKNQKVESVKYETHNQCKSVRDKFISDLLAVTGSVVPKI